ncbi:MAG: hypothetical protein JWR69_4734 [Pedosphaera sp.]|nr:hypothetical protein [Pedosphaera sp.]
MQKLESLKKLAKTYRETQGELARLDTVHPQLEADSARLKQELSGPIGEALTAHQPGDQHFDKATDEKLRELSVLNTKLELLPGVRRRNQAYLKTIGEQIEALEAEMVVLARHESRAQVEAIIKKLEPEMLTICGGDAHRCKLALKAVIPFSEAHRWLQLFLNQYSTSEPLARAENMIAVIERFKSGHPRSPIV